MAGSPSFPIDNPYIMKGTGAFIGFLLLIANHVSGAVITAISNGNWGSASTWDLNRSPDDNDDVVIPIGRQVFFSGSPYPKNNPSARPTLRIKIFGTFDFSNSGNDKLYLDAGSNIQIFTNGQIITTSTGNEIIAIHNGSSDNTVWNGSPAVINGPASATATTVGFQNGILPVKIESFTMKKSGDGIATLTWVSATETNSAYFVIETINAQHAGWQSVHKVKAAGESSVNTVYHYTTSLLPGNNQFRLKMVDVDGKFTYSAVVNWLQSAALTADITYDIRTHQIRTSALKASEKAQLHIYNDAGHLIASYRASDAISFAPSAAGVYIFTLLAREMKSSKKIWIGAR
jgi:hypothetical protein